MKKLTAVVLALTLCLCACGALAEHFVIATDTVFKPFEYTDASGNFVGIDVDIAQAICDKLGYELEVADMEFDAILPAVQSGKADFGAAGMTVNEERLESVDFTDTYANASQVIIVKK